MNCSEAAEFVSALFDGEKIPLPAAEHIGSCAICGRRLKEYAEMGAELRRAASLDFAEEVPPFSWNKPQRTFTRWWHTGRETMRIPRFAFASLLVAMFVLTSSLVVVGVRAHDSGTVVMLKIARMDGSSTPCALSTQDKKWATCAMMGFADSGSLIYQFELLSRDGDRVQLGVRSKFSPWVSGPNHSSTSALSEFDSLTQQQYSFEPGETLQVNINGYGKLTVTGDWMDHMPALWTSPQESIDPGANELRMIGPILLREKLVVGDLEGGSSFEDQGHQIVTYYPGEGRFLISLSPMTGAVEGHVKLNRLYFDSNGQTYEFVTGAPITRSDKVWVLHDPHYTPPNSDGKSGFIGNWDENAGGDSTAKH